MLGFHCRLNSPQFSGKHVAAIVLPLLVVAFLISVWWYRRSDYGFSASVLINENTDDSFSGNENEGKLPWETNEKEGNKKFNGSQKKIQKDGTHVRTTFKPVSYWKASRLEPKSDDDKIPVSYKYHRILVFHLQHEKF